MKMKILFLVIYGATIFMVTTTANAQNHQNFVSGLDQGITPSIRILNTVGKKGSDRNKYDLNIPTDIAVNEMQQIIVVDAGAHKLKFYDQSGVYLKQIGKKGSYPGEFKTGIKYKRSSCSTTPYQKDFFTTTNEASPRRKNMFTKIAMHSIVTRRTNNVCLFLIFISL